MARNLSLKGKVSNDFLEINHASPPLSTEELVVPIGGRLQVFWPLWQQMGASPWVVSTLRLGYNLEFIDQPPNLSLFPVVKTFSLKKETMMLLEEHITELLQIQALEPVLHPNSPGFYSRIFLVPKKAGKLRPVIDLSTLNLYLKPKPFKMETSELVRQSLSPNMWTFSLDLSNAYFHIPIHPASRKYLRIEFRGKIYQFRALPFGLKTAPWLFTMVFREVKVLALKQDVPILLYLDDWLGKAQSRQICAQRAARLVALCKELGIVINHEKSDFIPRQRFDFVGTHYDLIQFQVFPTQANLAKVEYNMMMILSSKALQAQVWQSIIGVVSSQDRLIPYGRLHVRPFQIHLLDHWDPFSGDPMELIPTAPVTQAAVWWLHRKNLMKGVPLVPPPYTLRIYTDACIKGWGAHMDEHAVQGLWSPEESVLHINVLEMRAVVLAIQAFPTTPGDVVMISSDNTTVVAYINHQGGTRSKSLWLETLQLFQLAMKKGLFLRAVHIPGRLNVIADQLSRLGQTLPTEWSLHPGVVQALFREWGMPQVDLFATRFNHKCQLFVSPVPDSLAMGTDALSISWEGLWAYAFPPHQILSKVLAKMRQHSCQLIIIAPLWPKRPWFPDLLEWSIQLPFKLPPLPKLLKQPKMSVFHQMPEYLNLHAWLLKSMPCNREVSPKQRLKELWPLRGCLPLQYMRENGDCSLPGVTRGSQIPFKHLFL